MHLPLHLTKRLQFFNIIYFIMYIYKYFDISYDTTPLPILLIISSPSLVKLYFLIVTNDNLFASHEILFFRCSALTFVSLATSAGNIGLLFSRKVRLCTTKPPR